MAARDVLLTAACWLALSIAVATGYAMLRAADRRRGRP
jgi:hypothetical protein